MDPNVVLERIMRLARFDTTVFDDVRDDPNETIPAAVVAVISAFLAGLGAMLYWEVVTDFSPDGTAVNNLILGSILLVAMYAVGVLVTYVVLAQGFRIQAELQPLIRTAGYAAIPFALSVLMLIPVLYPVFALVPLMLVFVFLLHATMSATGAPTREATLAVTAGFAVMVLVLGLIAQQSDIQDAPIGAGQFGLYWDI